MCFLLLQIVEAGHYLPPACGKWGLNRYDTRVRYAGISLWTAWGCYFLVWTCLGFICRCIVWRFHRSEQGSRRGCGPVSVGRWGVCAYLLFTLRPWVIGALTPIKLVVSLKSPVLVRQDCCDQFVSVRKLELKLCQSFRCCMCSGLMDDAVDDLSSATLWCNAWGWSVLSPLSVFFTLNRTALFMQHQSPRYFLRHWSIEKMFFFQVQPPLYLRIHSRRD